MGQWLRLTGEGGLSVGDLEWAGVPTVSLRLTSDVAWTQGGFSAAYEIRPPKPCTGGDLVEPSGLVSVLRVGEGGTAGDYANNAACLWTFKNRLFGVPGGALFSFFQWNWDWSAFRTPRLRGPRTLAWSSSLRGSSWKAALTSLPSAVAKTRRPHSSCFRFSAHMMD